MKTFPNSLPVRALAVLAAVFAFAQMAVAQTSYTWNPGGADENWSTPGNWSPNTGAGGPTALDSVIFGDTGTSADSNTVNNVVDAGFAGTVANLTYNSASATSSSAPVFNVTQIPSGQTLTVAGNLLVGGLNEGAGAYITYAYLTGGGALEVTGTNVFVENYGSAAGANATAYLDLSGLSDFIFNNTNAELSIADTTSGLTRAGGNLNLASVSNFIDVATINLATSSSAQAGPNSLLTLGAGTNIIYVSNFNIANNKNSADVTFAAPTGGLRIRGVSGADTDRANITIGNRNQTGTKTTTGTLVANGNPLDIKAATLIVGANPNTGTPGSAGTFGVGVLQFDTGTIDATTVEIAQSATPNLGSATGTVTVGPNGTLIAGDGGISLLSQPAENTGFTSSGTLNISNGVVNCAGNIVVTTNSAAGSGGAGNSAINFIGGGKLSVGPNSYIGTTVNPINNFNLIEGSTLEFGSPLANQTNVVVNSLTWPSDDSQLTITIDSVAGATNGSVIPLISCASLNGGTFTAPVLNLPAGITGSLSFSDNVVWLTITGGIVPGYGGVNQLTNPGFESGSTGWTTVGPGWNTPVITTGPSTFYHNDPSGACTPDDPAELVVTHSGTNVANMYGQFTGSRNVSSWNQEVATIAGTTFEAGAYTYVSHEDLMAGANSFYYEVDFLDDSGNLLAAYESYVVTNLTCGEVAPFAVDTWNFLGVTNQMEVTDGVNTGVLMGNVPSGILTAPPGAVNARLSAVFVQQSDNANGSIYFDDLNLGRISGPIPPTLSTMSPNLVAFSTNTALTCEADSTVSAINSVSVIVTSSALGGTPATVVNTATSDGTSSGLTVSGLGTATASISYALQPNLLYSVVVKATDANNVTVTSGTNTFDTLQPTLVIEAADFNFSSGQFLDTPPDGGFALYTNRVGTQGIDENKATRTNSRSYYRPDDAVVIQAATPNTGSPPTATEQKFVLAAANGDTTNIQLEVGYNTPGDWLNYTRTFGSSGSAPAGTYNIYCYLATSGTGTQSALSLVTSDSTQPNQTTNLLGYFGTSSFSDNGYNNYRYVPLTDQYGNLVSVTFTNGQQTLQSTVVGNPNLGLYILVPAVPVLTPALQYVNPTGATPFETNQYTFVVGPANGAPIDTNGIHLTVNGVDVSSGLSFSQQDGSWVVNYTLPYNGIYTVAINVTNEDGYYTTHSSTIDVFDLNAYQWEAVDYDFSTNDPVSGAWIGGQYINDPIPTGDTNAANGGGYLEVNSYFGFPTANYGAIAQPGIDFFYAATSGMQTNLYRGDNYVGQEITRGDYLRPKFIEAQETFSDPAIWPFDIGWFNNKDWLNYTRDWPTNRYNVWGRLAGGNAGGFSGTTLSLVTSGVGTTNQTTQTLGSFADPNAAGWAVWHWVPLLDDNGNPVVVQLGGKATLRLTSGGGLNAEFFLLAPAPAVAESFAVSAALSGGQIQISVPTETGFTYTLWYSPSLSAPSWSEVTSLAGDGNVHTIPEPSTDGQGYYRVSAAAQ